MLSIYLSIYLLFRRKLLCEVKTSFPQQFLQNVSCWLATREGLWNILNSVNIWFTVHKRHSASRTVKKQTATSTSSFYNWVSMWLMPFPLFDNCGPSFLILQRIWKHKCLFVPIFPINSPYKSLIIFQSFPLISLALFVCFTHSSTEQSVFLLNRLFCFPF